MSLLCVEPGGTRFVRAFAKAFQILKNTIKSSSEAIKKRPSMFLLITDGVTRSKSIEKNSLKAIKKEYKDFKQEVQLITSFKVLTLLLGGKVQKEGSFLKVLMNEMVRAQKYHKKKVKQEFNLLVNYDEILAPTSHFDSFNSQEWQKKNFSNTFSSRRVSRRKKQFNSQIFSYSTLGLRKCRELKFRSGVKRVTLKNSSNNNSNNLKTLLSLHRAAN